MTLKFHGMRIAAPLALLLAPALVACTGDAGSSDPGSRGDDDDDDNDDLPPGPPVAEECEDDLVDVGVRRLTRVEYANSVRDLFKGVELPEISVIGDPNPGGFENQADNLAPQETLVAGYQSMSARAAAAAVAEGSDFLDCEPQKNSSCVKSFVEDFGRRAFRRPLSDKEQDAFVDLHADLEAELGEEEALALTIEAFLQSPEFLYRVELSDTDSSKAEAVTGYDMATRLSYLIWGSIPDEELLDAAEAGDLSSAKEIRRQANRMLKDPRAIDQLVNFHREWLAYDHVVDDPEDKDKDRYPDFKGSMREDMREEALLFTRHVMEEGDGTLRALLTDTTSFLNEDLANVYGVKAPSKAWGKVDLDDGERAGILTRGFFLSGRAHQLQGSPPLRGVFLLEHMLCLTPGTPDPDADLSEPSESSGSEGLTNREAFEKRLEEGGRNCVGCHQAFDPLGNAFEHYDAVGAFREKDNGKPVDASGEIAGKSFDNALELMPILSELEDVRACLAGNILAFVHGRSRSTVSRCSEDALVERIDDGADMADLLLEAAGTRNFLYR